MRTEEFRAVLLMRDCVNDIIRAYDPGTKDPERRQREDFENLRKAAAAYREAKGWGK